MKYLAVKNWHEHQHYSTRNPPWIKLHKRLIDDDQFQALPVDSRALAPMLWLMASETDEGILKHDTQSIAFRLRSTKARIEKALKPLIDGGFLFDASAMLAQGKRVAMPEQEQEKSKRQSKSRDRARVETDTARVPLSVPDPPGILDPVYHAAFTKEAVRLRGKMPFASEKKISEMAMDDLKKRGMVAALKRKKSKPEHVGENVHDITDRLEKAMQERGA